MNNISRNQGEKAGKQAPEELSAWLQLVRKQVAPLKFGTVQITVHDAHIVQIERVEKQRFDKPDSNGG